MAWQWPGFSHRPKAEEELEEEMRFDLAEEARLRMDRGETVADAHAASRRDFGNATLVREDTRATWGWMTVERAWQDVRFACRRLRKSPGFAAVAVLSLAIGIGANTAIFSLADAILLKSMPVRDPEQLRLLLWTGEPRIPLHSSSGYATKVRGAQAHSSFPYPLYRQLTASVPLFSDLVGFAEEQVPVTGRGQNHFARAYFVSENFFSGLGVEAWAGRTLAADDHRAGGAPAAVLGYAYWERRFGLDSGAIGQNVVINGHPVRVAGVLPKAFPGLAPGRTCDLYIPFAHLSTLGLQWNALEKEDAWWVQMLGRLRPGVSTEGARKAVQGVADQAGEAYPAPLQKGSPWRVLVEPGGSGTPLAREYLSRPLLVLSGVVALVLLIACANLANLLLARGTARRREMALRLALGAGRQRLIAELLTESFLLAALGAGSGLVLARPLAHVVLRMAAGNGWFSFPAALDARTLAFTACASLLTVLLFGLAPALRATRVDLTPALKGGNAGAAGGKRHSLAARLLVVGQVALSTVLLTAAGLFLRSLLQVAHIDPGFQAQQVFLFAVDGGLGGYRGEKRSRLFEQILERIEAAPGVQSATFSSPALISDSVIAGDLSVPGYTPQPGKPAHAYILTVGPHFFSTMKMPMAAGNEPDGRNPREVVVNETFARRFLAGRSPMGERFSMERASAEVTGVVKDARYDNLKNDVAPTIYLSYRRGSPESVTFEVRTPLPPASIAGMVRGIVAELDRRIPVTDMRTQQEQIALSIGPERLFAGAVGSFGATAAVLAAIGLYGLMAYTVARRRAEMAIRMALGASPRDVQWMILRESLLLVAAGLGVGIPVALALTRLVRGLLFRVGPWDPASFAAAGVVMLAVAAAAAWIPVRRASRVDPVGALRQE